jgi:hypothetical protein
MEKADKTEKPSPGMQYSKGFQGMIAEIQCPCGFQGNIQSFSI